MVVSWGCQPAVPPRLRSEVGIGAGMEGRAWHSLPWGSGGGFGMDWVFLPLCHRLGTEHASNTSGDFQPGGMAVAGPQTPRSRNHELSPVPRANPFPLRAETDAASPP